MFGCHVGSLSREVIRSALMLMVSKFDGGSLLGSVLIVFVFSEKPEAKSAKRVRTREEVLMAESWGKS